MRSLAGLLTVLIFGACAPARVTMRYPAPTTPSEIALAKALAGAYLIVSPPQSALDFEISALARWTAASVEKQGGEIIAYRVSTESTDAYTDLLAPSGILRVVLDAPAVKQSRYEKEVLAVDPETGKAVKRIAVYWKHEARLTGRAALSSHPQGAILGSKSFAVGRSGEIQGKAAADARRAWLKREWPQLLKGAAAQIAGVGGNTTVVTRSRTLFIDKEDADSKTAANLARGGKWEEAASLWARRLEADRGNWRDLMNLALASERVRLYGEAKRIYARARATAGEDQEAKKIDWPQIEADLNGADSLSIGRAQAARDWFAAPIAVLPFSDDTTSVDGPAMLRELVWKTLTGGGYNAIPLEASDRALRMHGYSMGGQLRKGKPAQFAKWTGAARLLFGDITEFSDIMLGRFGKRAVEGKLRLWNADSGAFVWEGARGVVNQSAELRDENAAQARLSKQLGRAFLERWMGKPLGPESKDFVRINLQTLPLRPPRK